MVEVSQPSRKIVKDRDQRRDQGISSKSQGELENVS